MKKHVTTNKIERTSRAGLKALIALVVLSALGVGLWFGYESLVGLCRERAAITDFAGQVKIESGKMVRAEVIAEHFGLKKGANLATIDFAAKRRELLAKVPTLKSIAIRREMPDGVTIVAEERTPLARLAVGSSRRTTGHVVDAEGVVFVCQRGTQMLPTIREARAPGTAPGQTLSGRAAQALELISLSREPEYLELGVLEVDVAKPDYLTVTLANYSTAKIVWTNRDDLARRLRHLMTAIRSQVASGVKIWNVTQPDKVYADTQEKL